MGRLAEEERRPLAGPHEPEHDSHERCLASAVRACNRDELALAQLELDVLEHTLARGGTRTRRR